MSSFESELRKGRFVVYQCTKCGKIMWPPSDSCSSCFGNVLVRDVQNSGTIIECSAKDGRKFCIAEFEGVRIMGTISSPDPKPGQKIKIASCGFDKQPWFRFSD
jgi:uncharacterized OB-fold protein